MLPFEEVKRKPEPLTESQVWGAAAPTPVEPQCDGQCAYCKQPLLNAWRHADGSLICTHPELRPAEPAKSQGVERAQPVEGPRETFWVIERFEDGRSAGYWFGNSSREFSGDIEKAVQFRRKQDAQIIRSAWHWKDCEVTEHAYMSPAAPVEGVERVTDDVPARVELDLPCLKCGGSGISTSGLDCVCTAQPAKHTDDRPAETIPEALGRIGNSVHNPDVCECDLWPGDGGDPDCKIQPPLEPIGAWIVRLQQRIGRAETRIEVLEAALREKNDTLRHVQSYFRAQPRKPESLMNEIRAALAAPSGEKV